MTEPDSTSFADLDTTDAARVLLTDERRYLEPFMGRERSVGEVAKELGVAVDALAYRVRRLVALGLLQQIREVPRKGRAVKYYRAPKGYVASLHVLPVVDLEALLRTLDAPMREAFVQGFAAQLEQTAFMSWTVRCYRDSEDRVRLELAPPVEGWTPEAMAGPEVPALTLNWLPLALTTAQAKALQGELFELMSRYQAFADVPTHVLGLFLAPHRRD